MNKHKFYGAFLAFTTVATVSMGAMASSATVNNNMNNRCIPGNGTSTTIQNMCMGWGAESYVLVWTCTDGGYYGEDRYYCGINAPSPRPIWLDDRCNACSQQANDEQRRLISKPVAESITETLPGVSTVGLPVSGFITPLAVVEAVY